MRAPASSTDGGIVSLRDLVDFISHVADCYPDVTATFPQDLIEILALHHARLEAELREKIVSSLVLLRKKEIIDSSTYVPRRGGLRRSVVFCGVDAWRRECGLMSVWVSVV